MTGNMNVQVVAGAFAPDSVQTKRPRGAAIVVARGVGTWARSAPPSGLCHSSLS